MPTLRWLAGALAALACGVAVGACGDGDDRAVPRSERPTATATPSSTPTPPATARTPAPTEEPLADVDPDDVRIVRAWADTLRRGEVRAAARYFALPSLVSNGTAPIRLATRAEAEFFNRTLPCGADLIDTEPASTKGFFIATFRLTERPGRGSCGTGTGSTARTAFRVRDAHITDWLRVQDLPSGPETLS